jgi:hypothetical protein
MKAGDLVTLSSYCLQSAPMWPWREKIWKQKKPLVGLVVRVAPNPRTYSFTSVNERTHYYVRWMQDGPGSRYGRSFHKLDGYFLRNDLKFVKKGDFK